MNAPAHGTVIVVFLGIMLLALLALQGERRFAGRSAAPSRLSLAVFPVTGTIMLIVLWQGGGSVFILAIVLLAVAAVNLLYFRAIGRAIPAAPLR